MTSVFYTGAALSSASDNWSTPQDFYDKLNEEFHFGLDVCASQENAKCSFYFSVENDGLKQDWAWQCREIVDNYFVGYCAAWMNPPYGRTIRQWMKKAYEESLRGVTVVCLVPARTDTKWWHDYAIKGEVRFIKGRLKFGGCKNSAPFPSAVVIFRGLKG